MKNGEIINYEKEKAHTIENTTRSKEARFQDINVEQIDNSTENFKSF